MHFRRTHIALLLGIVFSLFFITLSVPAVHAATISPDILNQLTENATTQVIVELYDLTELGITQTQQANTATPDELFAALQHEVTLLQEATLAQLPNTSNVALNHQYKSIRAFSATIDKKGLKQLATNKLIKAIYPDKQLRIQLQDSVPIIGVPEFRDTQSYNYDYTGRGVGVCVIDSGIDYTHPSLGNCTTSQFLAGTCARVVGGHDFINNDADPKDDHRHGTHVAGIVGANGSITGVAPGVHFVATKACNSAGSCNTAAVIAAIDYCVTNKNNYSIKIIQMSIGDEGEYTSSTCDPYAPMRSALNSAKQNNIFTAIAAGNEGHTNGIAWPACMPNATAVGSTTKQDSISSFSNYGGDRLDLFAPGGETPSATYGINSTVLNGVYARVSGTSMATPHVAGAVALINEALNRTGKTLTVDQIEKLLQDTGKTISSWKRIRVNIALRNITYDVNTTTNTIATPSGIITFHNSTSFTNFASCVSIRYNNITVNATLCPAMNKNATLRINNLPYNFTPLILRDNQLCTNCTPLTYNNGNFTFNVTGFSTYTTSAVYLSITDNTTMPTYRNTPVRIIANYTNTTGTAVNVSGAICALTLTHPQLSTILVDMTYNATTKLHTHNFTATIPGTYNATITCNSPQDLTEITRTHTITILDYSLTINITSPQNNTKVRTTNFTINFTPTSTINATVNYTFYLYNATNVNGTVVRDTRIRNITNTTSTTKSLTFTNLAPGPYQFIVNITDQAGHTTTSGTRTIYFGNTFSIQLIAPQNSSYVFISPFTVQFRVHDTAPQPINYTLTVYNYTTIIVNQTTNATNTTRTLFTTRNGTAYSGNLVSVAITNLTNQNVSLIINSTNSYADQNTAGLITFFLDTYSTVTSISPANNANITTSNITFIWNATHLTNQNVSCDILLNSQRYDINITTHSRGTITPANYTLSPVDSNYTWNATCTDSAANNYTSTTRTFTKDTTPPNITLLSPTNTIINTSNYIPFRYFINDTITGISSCTLRVYTGNTTSANATAALNTTENVNLTKSLTIYNGNYSWTLNCTNTFGLTRTTPRANFTVNVINAPPVHINNITNQTIAEDRSLVLSLRNIFNDTNNDPLNYTLITTANITARRHNSTAINITPAADLNGNFTFRINATDVLDASALSNNFTLHITPVDDPPRYIANISNLAWDEDTTNTNALDLDNYFTEVDGEPLTYNVTGNTNIAITIHATTHQVTFSQPANWYGVERVKFSATDGTTRVNSTNVTLTVANVAEPSSGSGGGGGGGGGASTTTTASTPPKITQTFTNIQKNKTYAVKNTNAQIPITNITFAPQKNITALTITVAITNTTSVKKTSALITTPVYNYLNITTTSTNLTNITIIFTVNKTWIAAQKTTINNIRLYHYKTAWTPLTTLHLSTSTTQETFSARTLGFSYFAIGANETPATTQTSTPVSSSSPTTTPTPPTTPTTNTTLANATVTPSDNTTTIPSSSTSTTTTPQAFRKRILLLMIVVIIVAAFAIYRLETHPPQPRAPSASKNEREETTKEPKKEQKKEPKESKPDSAFAPEKNEKNKTAPLPKDLPRPPLLTRITIRLTNIFSPLKNKKKKDLNIEELLKD